MVSTTDKRGIEGWNQEMCFAPRDAENWTSFEYAIYEEQSHKYKSTQGLEGVVLLCVDRNTLVGQDVEMDPNCGRLRGSGRLEYW